MSDNKDWKFLYGTSCKKSSSIFSRAVSQLCSLNGNYFCMKSHNFSEDVWGLTEWNLLIGWKQWSHDLRERVCCFLLDKDTTTWCHLGDTTKTNFQSNFKPQARQDKVDTTRDSISSLISSHKPGKIPQRHHMTPWGGNHGLDTMGWTPWGTAFLV